MNHRPFLVVVRGFALACAVATVAIACDDGADPESAGPGGAQSEVSSFDAFVQQAATRYCARRVVPCCQAPASTDQAKCEADVKLELTEEIGGEGGTYSSEGGARCLAAIDTLSCGSDRTALDRACRDIMRGPDFHRKQGGETCARESDCAAPAEGSATCNHGCDPGDASCTVGYCVAFVEVLVGAACNEGGDRTTLVRRCGPDALCLADVCKAIPGTGETCPNGLCRDGLRCTSSGVCEAFVAPGQPCTQAAECAAGYCDVQTNTCPTETGCK